MLELLAVFAAFAALGLAAWLRERVARLESEVAALRARENDLSAPSRAAGPSSSPVAALQPESVDVSSKVNMAAEQAATPERATEAGAADAPPVAFPAPPVAFTPPPIHPSKQTTDTVASPAPFEAGAMVREGAERNSPLAPPAAACKGEPVDWESFVGVKLFSWIAGIFLTIGAILFLRYSIDHGWLSEPVQMAIGIRIQTSVRSVRRDLSASAADTACPAMW